MPNWNDQVQRIMKERFGHDCLIALATVDASGEPHVRTVNAYFEEEAFYIVTYALSNKMKHIANNACVAISGEWFSAQGIGDNLGYVLKNENFPLTDKLRSVFSSWYGNGHVNEQDTNTCILRVRITKGTLFSNGTRYDI